MLFSTTGAATPRLFRQVPLVACRQVGWIAITPASIDDRYIFPSFHTRYLFPLSIITIVIAVNMPDALYCDDCQTFLRGVSTMIHQSDDSVLFEHHRNYEIFEKAMLLPGALCNFAWTNAEKLPSRSKTNRLTLRYTYPTYENRHRVHIGYLQLNRNEGKLTDEMANLILIRRQGA